MKIEYMHVTNLDSSLLISRIMWWSK